MPHYLSTDEVAAALQCSRQNVNCMARQGHLPVAGTVGRNRARFYPIWVPTSANKNDADGTAVLASFQSAAYVEGVLSYAKTTSKLKVTYDLRGSGSPTATVSADTKLNVADASYTSLAPNGGT